MVYQGSKAKLKKYLIPILQKCIDDNGVTNYVEPFVGGANIIDSIKCEHRIASDINKELISLLTYMQLNPELDIAPDECSFEHYADVRENRKNKTNKYSETYTTLIGYFASYGGRYFDGGYGRDSKGGRCIYKERLANAREQAPLLNGIEFFPADYKFYTEAGIKGAVFYLDPPYKNTKSYNNQKFNHEDFYDFCRQLSKDNWVFISEYSMPDDFECIWQKERKVLQKADRSKGDTFTEKLFVYKGGLVWQKN